MDHPARRIRSTNAVLPASEISSVRNRLSDAKTDLTYLSIQIMAASSAVLDQLLDRRAELTAEIEAYQITLAPHKKLPRNSRRNLSMLCSMSSLPPAEAARSSFTSSSDLFFLEISGVGYSNAVE